MKLVIKKSSLIYACLGLLIGIFIFVSSIIGIDIPFQFGNHEIHGIAAGMISIFFVPLVMAFVGAIHGIFIWFPITYILNKLLGKSDN